MVSNPAHQGLFLPGDEFKDRSVIENSAAICNSFPPDHKDLCINGAVDNIINFDDLDLTRIEQLCHLVDGNLKQYCFRRIGLNLTNIAHSKDETIKVCHSLKKKEDVQSCLEGAHVETRKPQKEDLPS
jgi:hypothetical protein